MALGTFIAGRYAGTYNAVDVGIADDDGYKLQMESKAEMIDASDAYGQSAIDWIYQGGNCYLGWMGKEYKAGGISAFWPYGAFGQMSTPAAPLGRLATAIAAAMVLTSTANTPAAAAPATLTCTQALLAPNSTADINFSMKLRKVPVRLQFLPYSDGSGGFKWFGVT